MAGSLDGQGARNEESPEPFACSGSPSAPPAPKFDPNPIPASIGPTHALIAAQLTVAVYGEALVPTPVTTTRPEPVRKQVHVAAPPQLRQEGEAMS